MDIERYDMKFKAADPIKLGDIVYEDGEGNLLKYNGAEYPLAKTVLSGLHVMAHVPNTESISSSLYDYKILKGIRAFPMSEFEFGTNPTDRVKNLAADIKQSKKIAPLIVVVDKEGPYILEGSHRIDALHILKVKEIPAMVVVDLESIEAWVADSEDVTRWKEDNS